MLNSWSNDLHKNHLSKRSYIKARTRIILEANINKFVIFPRVYNSRDISRWRRWACRAFYYYYVRGSNPRTSNINSFRELYNNGTSTRDGITYFWSSWYVWVRSISNACWYKPRKTAHEATQCDKPTISYSWFSTRLIPITSDPTKSWPCVESSLSRCTYLFAMWDHANAVPQSDAEHLLSKTLQGDILVSLVKKFIRPPRSLKDRGLDSTPPKYHVEIRRIGENTVFRTKQFRSSRNDTS